MEERHYLTIKELYEYCKERGAEDYVVKIQDIDWVEISVEDVWIGDDDPTGNFRPRTVYLA